MAFAGPIDIGAVRATHARFIRDQQLIVERALQFAGDFAHQHVAAYSRFQRRSASSLKDATKHQVIRLRGGGVLRITSAKRYASYVEHGTRAHIILPRRARMLRFEVKSGAVVFARAVRHPGTPAFRFLYNATDAAGRVLTQMLENEMARSALSFH